MGRTVIATLGARRGDGASVFAASIADRLAAAGGSVALMDVSPPYANSDLKSSQATAQETGQEGVEFRVHKRGTGATVVGLGSSLPQLREQPGGFFALPRVPLPDQWWEAAGHPSISVLDTTWNVLELINHPADPVTGWFRDPTASVWPFLVSSLSTPSLRAAEQMVAGMNQLRDSTSPDPGCGIGAVTLLVQLSAQDSADDVGQVIGEMNLPLLASLAQRGRVVSAPFHAGVYRNGVTDPLPKAVEQVTVDALYISGAVNPRQAKAAAQ